MRLFCVFFFKQKTAYEIGTGDWSSDVCSSDLTCDSKTIIDLVFTNSNSSVNQLEVLASDISDHFAVRFNVNTNVVKSPGYYKTQRDFRKFDENEFFEHAKAINFHHTEDFSCPHKAAQYLESKIELLIDQFAPRSEDTRLNSSHPSRSRMPSSA